MKVLFRWLANAGTPCHCQMLLRRPTARGLALAESNAKRRVAARHAVVSRVVVLTVCMMPLVTTAQIVPSESPVALAVQAQEHAAAATRAAGTQPDSRIAADLAAQAIGTARHALELNNSIGIAYLALGLAYRQIWRWEEALAAFEQAYLLNPSDPNTAFNVSWLQAFSGNYDRALEVAEQAVAYNPVSANAHRDLGIVNAYAGQLEPALAALQRCTELEPSIGVCHIYQGFMLFRLGDNANAERALREAERLFGESMSPAAASSLAHAYSRIGQRGDARRLFERLTAMGEERVVGAGTWPLAYLAIGETVQAADWLERAVEKAEAHLPDEGFFNMMIIKANVQASSVLEQPRFVELRNRLGATN